MDSLFNMVPTAMPQDVDIAAPSGTPAAPTTSPQPPATAPLPGGDVDLPDDPFINPFEKPFDPPVLETAMAELLCSIPTYSPGSESMGF